ncbi:transmembrane protease serine 3-like [Copidosoma floridanum]|uniref:transmembrane protease serine 3-like n=1 Tax=Copidosoma floridanum TaxID=29053 RepID=UPI000C6FA2CD|nr:transmembrane protease serine 3-like [Copidosoma floridanum]
MTIGQLIPAGLESERIIGGHLAKKHQFKYFVSIQLRQFHHCGGALIAPNIVLTAAHCVYDSRGISIHKSPFKVIVGTTNANDDTYSSRVIKIYAHLKYRYQYPGDMNDIAVLRLEKSFDGRLPIGLVSLPLENEDFIGKTAVTMGFGWDKIREVYSPALKDTLEFGESSGQLRYEFVDVVRTDRCDLDQKTLCAHMKQGLYGAPQGVCGHRLCQFINQRNDFQGDSGGPLVYDNKVIGIVSLSPKGCDESYEPASYTKVSKYLDFIKNAIHDKETSDMFIQSNN